MDVQFLDLVNLKMDNSFLIKQKLLNYIIVIYYIRAYDCLFSDDYPSFKQMMKLAIDECKKVNDTQLLSYFYEELVYISRNYEMIEDEIFYRRLLIHYKK